MAAGKKSSPDAGRRDVAALQWGIFAEVAVGGLPQSLGGRAVARCRSASAPYGRKSRDV